MAIKRAVRKTANSDTTLLTDLFAEFIIEKEATNKSPATIRNYQKSFQKWCEYYGDMVETSEVTQSLFFQWANSQKLDGCRPATINHYLRDMRTFMNWCMDNQYIAKFVVPMVEEQEEVPKFYTKAEQELLVAKPSRNDDYTVWRMWCIVNFILATGARTSTVIAVRMKDIDLKGKKITYWHTKNKSAQIVPMSSTLVTVLKEFIKQWRTIGVSEEDYLFANIGNEQLTPNALRIAFRKYCQQRGVEKTSIHGLRHTFSREWILNDGSILGLQKMLGHSTLEMTRKYVKLFAEDLSEGFDSYNPLDNLKKSSSRRKVVRKS